MQAIDFGETIFFFFFFFFEALTNNIFLRFCDPEIQSFFAILQLWSLESL